MPSKGTVPVALRREETQAIAEWLRQLCGLKGSAVDPELAALSAWFSKTASRKRPADAFTVNIQRHWAAWFVILWDYPNGFQVNGVALPLAPAVSGIAQRCADAITTRGRQPENIERTIEKILLGHYDRDDDSSRRNKRRAYAKATEENLRAGGATVLGNVELWLALDKIRRN